MHCVCSDGGGPARLVRIERYDVLQIASLEHPQWLQHENQTASLINGPLSLLKRPVSSRTSSTLPSARTTTVAVHISFHFVHSGVTGADSRTALV